MSNKRYAVKHVRDLAKSGYEKASSCYICPATEDLDFHHFHSLVILFKNWASSKGYDISTDAGVLEVRQEFIDTHHKELYEDTVTLCHTHHLLLHSIFGKAPLLSTAMKQKEWCERKRSGGEIESPFSKFL